MRQRLLIEATILDAAMRPIREFAARRIGELTPAIPVAA